MADAAETGTVIDLSKRDVQALEFKEVIQQGAMKRLAALLTKRIESVGKPAAKDVTGEVEDDGSPLFLDRRHGTILIHGGRGSGKTTFIRNAFHLIRNGDGPFKDLKGSLSILGVVDPTLIERKEHIFIIVVNKLRQAVEKVRKEKGENGAEGKISFKDWKDSLKEMAQGLSLLDNIGPDRIMGDVWEDSHYVTEKGLEKAQAGAKLEQNFHSFVGKSLAFIGKKAFVLALDDIDTDFQSGWPILEVLRRYLTSPHFIVIMSGDMALYSILVRGHKWANFDKRHLRYDREQESSIVTMVGHLQSQYLLKLLSPQNRIALKPLTQLDRSRIEVLPPQEKKKSRLDDFLGTVVQEGLGLRGEMEADIVALLLRQPLRTVMQLMHLHSDRDEEYGIAEQLAPVFTDVMLRYNLSPDELQEASGGQFLVRLVRFLTENKLWSTGHALRPDHQSDDLNQTLLVLAVQLNNLIKAQPHLSIAYMIQIALAREVLVARLPSQSQNPEEFIRYIEIDRHRTLTGMAGRLVAVIGAAETNAGSRLGIIQVRKRGGRNTQEIVRQMYGLVPNSNTYETSNEYMSEFYHAIQMIISFGNIPDPSLLGNYYNTMESLIDRLPSRLVQNLAALPVCQVLKPSGARSTFLSVYRLLGVVGRLLEPSAGRELSAVQTLITVEGLIRDYPIPPWLAGDKPGTSSLGKSLDETEPVDEMDEDGEGEVGISSVGDKREVAVIDALRKWSSGNTSPHVALPPSVLARVMTRFFYALAAIDDAIGPRDRFLGHLLHRQIVAFLNALLIEEATYRSVPQSIHLRNAVTKDDIFIQNLELLTNIAPPKRGIGSPTGVAAIGPKTFDTVPFFNRVFSCPLWGAYLNPSSEAFSAHMSAGGHKEADESLWIAKVDYSVVQAKTTAIFPNLYSLFNSVTVLGVDVRSAAQRKNPAGEG